MVYPVPRFIPGCNFFAGGVVMSVASLKQAQELLALFSREDPKKTGMQSLLQSGLLTELARANSEHVDREAFRAALVANEPPECYIVSVDYYLTLDLMLKHAGLDKVHADITGANFPHKRHQVHKVEIRLRRFGCQLHHLSVLQRLSNPHERHAELPEILALATAKPELQRRSWIVSFGSSFEDGDCVKYPLLYGNEGGRGLNLAWRDLNSKWPGDCRFATVSTEPLAA